MKPGSFFVVALVIGFAYLIATPPDRVPDEVGHFWRSCAIARGDFSGAGDRRQPHSTSLPVGLKTFVWVMYQTGEADKFEAEQFRTAWSIPLEDVKQVSAVVYPTHYTIAPYLAQSLAALCARLTGLRPFLTFYLGRIANLLGSLLLVSLAIRIAPRHAPMFAAAALLPMSLYEFASWSADAPTIGWAFLLTAMLLEPAPPDRRTDIAIAAVALMAALTKPAYFLVALFAFVSPMPLRRKIVVLLSTGLGTAIAMSYANGHWYNTKSTVPIDPAAQMRCIEAAPRRALAVMVRDVATNGSDYVQEMIGRLGLLDVRLPPVLVGLALLVLVVAALSTGLSLGWRQRLVIALVTAGTFAGIQLSQYLTWSITCGDVIEGIQGRYFLPIVPFVLAAIPIERWRWRLDPKIIVGAMALFNMVGIGFVIRRYW